MRALLDVNVLVALLDRQHAAHDRAHAWLADNLRAGWGSCPLTENGCVRVLSNPRYPAPVAAADVVAKLAVAKRGGHDAFWSDDVTITDGEAFDHRRWRGHQQITDAYLLALAIRHGGRLVTFDGGVSREIVPGAGPEHLVVL